MQSYLQYRRFGQLVRQQIEGDREKANDLTKGVDTPIDGLTDLEKRGLEDEEKQADTPAHDDRAAFAGSPDLEPPNEDVDLEALHKAERMPTQTSERGALGYAMSGIEARDRRTNEGKSGKVFVVGWNGKDDPMNPHNFSIVTKVAVTMRVAMIAGVVTMASSIDSAVLPQAAAEFGVSEVTESLATGIYLIGFGCGTLLAGPLSETHGRNAVYMGSLVLFMIFVMASGLAPNIGAQIAFRFLAGYFGSPALTLSGGTIADIFDPLAKTWGFPLFAVAGFGGPILGPVVGSYMGPSTVIPWRWTDWITLITAGLVFSVIFLFQPETYAPIIMKWKASQLRKATGDDRYQAELEILGESMWKKVGDALARPFILVRTELIVGLMTLYLSVIYIVLFTFLDGYTYIFSEVYGTSQGLTNVIFVAMFCGVLLSFILVPFVYHWTKKHIQRVEAQGRSGIKPETRLWFAMFGAPTMPISLFWMAWTDYSSVSIWSPILASTLFGFSVICIFMSAYMYIIDSYLIYAASALTFVALVRYVAAGGMTVVGIPFYKNMGPHWTLTIMACISLLCAPIPFALYVWGPRVRKHSKWSVNKDA